MKTTLTVEGVTVTIESARPAPVNLTAATITFQRSAWAIIEMFVEDQGQRSGVRVRSEDPAHVVVEPLTLWAYRLFQLVERGFVPTTAPAR
jgi:hypothetical protein